VVELSGDALVRSLEVEFQQMILSARHSHASKTLKENLPKAMAAVPVELIRKWEHRMWHYIEAYDDGLGAKEAQERVKQPSSKKYLSHRRP